MALILQIETSTSSCSVALSEDGEVVSFKEVNERNAHASSLTVFMEDVLKEAGKTSSDLSAVAVSMGPGSYTGLRIGVSAAKGLCYALDIPLIAVNTLKCMANGVLPGYLETEVLLCPMIDARRMEVYTAVFNKQLDELESVEAKIIDNDSFQDLLSSHKLVFFGDGAFKCRTVLEHNKNALFVDSFINSARHMSALVYEKYVRRQFEDIAYFEPYYLKDFIAGAKTKGTSA